MTDSAVPSLMHVCFGPPYFQTADVLSAGIGHYLIMSFDPNHFTNEVASILALDGNGERLMPLAGGSCSSAEARKRLGAADAHELFPGTRAPEAALAGLWLYFSCLDECHEIAQQIGSAEGSFWHGIMHRQEPDAANAGYWFRRVGRHAIFTDLHARAAEIVERFPHSGIRLASEWDAHQFIDICERARRQAASALEQAALEIQRAEWQLLFDYCARPSPRT